MLIYKKQVAAESFNGILPLFILRKLYCLSRQTLLNADYFTIIILFISPSNTISMHIQNIFKDDFKLIELFATRLFRDVNDVQDILDILDVHPGDLRDIVIVCRICVTSVITTISMI
jgi:hypothetical protein